jgi:hydrogenase/urease accessory protein HupE
MLGDLSAQQLLDLPLALSAAAIPLLVVPISLAMHAAALSATVSALGAAFGVVQALALGEHADAQPVAYAAWLAANMAQLVRAGLPQRLWQRLWQKLETEVRVNI